MAYVWITNYLYDRKQYVSFNKPDSPNEKVNFGVPQEAILSPLFLMYIHDNVLYPHFCFLCFSLTIQICLLQVKKNIENLICLMNTELKKY